MSRKCAKSRQSVPKVYIAYDMKEPVVEDLLAWQGVRVSNPQKD